MLLYRFVQNLRTPTQAEFARADINQDGQLDVADILLLQKQLLQVWLGISTAVTSADTERPDTKTNAALWALNWLIKPAYALPGNSGFLYYVHNDPLGTPQALTDESGTTVWTADYDPFGKATTNEDPDGDGNSVTLNVRFPGQYYDQETGLHYNGFRTYDPNTGRYLTADPIGQFLGIHPVPNIPRGLFNYIQTLQDLELASKDLNHPYAYVSSNPVGSIDPYGLLDFNGSVGAGGSFHAGPVGLGATTSIAGDTNGRICIVTQICGTFGMGIFGNLGISGSIGTGALCEGASPSGGFFAEGGAGITGSGSITTNGNGGTIGKAVVGIGGGGAGGVISCQSRTICFN